MGLISQKLQKFVTPQNDTEQRRGSVVNRLPFTDVSVPSKISHSVENTHGNLKSFVKITMAYAMRAVGCGSGGEPMSCTLNTLNARGTGLVWGCRPRAIYDLGAFNKCNKFGRKGHPKTRRVACWVIKNESQSEEREADKWLLENPSVPNLSEKDIEKEMGRRYERSVRRVGVSEDWHFKF